MQGEVTSKVRARRCNRGGAALECVGFLLVSFIAHRPGRALREAGRGRARPGGGDARHAPQSLQSGMGTCLSEGSAMPRNHLTVIESPWEGKDDGELAEHSMRPFVEGLCALRGWKLTYRTFTSARELGRLLEGEALDVRADRQLVYIACHGGGGRLQAGTHEPETINLASIADKLASGVEGVWLGACDLATSRSLDRFLTDRGALWAGGYSCSVDWSSCMHIDIAVLDTLMRGRPLDRRRAIVNALCEAWVVGDDDDDADVELGAALRVVARDKGGRAADVTQELKDALGWVAEDE